MAAQTYMIGMWLMYERTRDVVVASLANADIPPTPQEIVDAIGNQIFGVVGSSEFPLVWFFAGSLTMQLLLVVLVPGLLALISGWLAGFSQSRFWCLPIDLDAGDDIGAGAAPVPE